jgi:peptide deformylase
VGELVSGSLARNLLLIANGGGRMAQPKLDARYQREQAKSPASPSSGTHLRVPVRPIVEHPNPILARPCDEVDPMYPAIVELAAILIATMRVSPGCIGLSAPQIGESVRLFAMNVTGHKKAKSCAGLVVLANPRIITRAGNVVMREGCASVPWLTGDVARAEEVIVTGVLPGNGHEVILTANGIEARCIQHEVDHLDGILFVDRVQEPVAELYTRRHLA